MIPTWLKDKTIAVWDIETDYVPSTIMYCISVSIVCNGLVTHRARVYTAFWTPYSCGNLMQAITLINSCDYQSGHNTVGFDIPTTERLMNVKITPPSLDTIILAKIIFSKDDLYAMDAELGVDKDLWGKYALKAFGQRMGDFKIDFNNFTGLTEEMAIYCNQDTDLTARLLIFLLGKDNFPLESVVTIEHQAASVIAEQTAFGFYLDITKTRLLNTELLQEKGALARELAEIFGPKFLKDGPVKQYKKVSRTRMYLPNKDYIPVW